jgi:hypothetical protein
VRQNVPHGQRAGPCAQRTGYTPSRTRNSLLGRSNCGRRCGCCPFSIAPGFGSGVRLIELLSLDRARSVCHYLRSRHRLVSLRRSAFAFTSSSNCALLPMRIHDSRSFKNIAFSLPSDVLCACAPHAAAFSQAFVARSLMS